VDVWPSQIPKELERKPLVEFFTSFMATSSPVCRFTPKGRVKKGYLTGRYRDKCRRKSLHRFYGQVGTYLLHGVPFCEYKKMAKLFSSNNSY